MLHTCPHNNNQELNTGWPCTVKQFAVDNNYAQGLDCQGFPNLVPKTNKKRELRRDNITSVREKKKIRSYCRRRQKGDEVKEDRKGKKWERYIQLSKNN